MAKIISAFNHKGGVAKTTSVYHIGWKMTEMGKKVLLVDADSQCNLSQVIMKEEGFADFLREYPKQNIKDALEPAFTAQTRLIKPVDCVKVENNDSLWLLPGSMDLETYAVQLGFSFLNAFGTTQNLPGSFYYLLTKTAEKYDCDLILVDMNPSLGAINQDLLISSDYFLIPTAPDYLSMMAMSSLSRVIPEWEKWAKNARNIFMNAVYPLPPNTPKFIGYTTNDFNIKRGKPTRAVQAEMDKIESMVNEKLVPSLDAVGMLLDRNVYQGTFRLGIIQDFQSTLKTKYQVHGLPVWKLDKDHLAGNYSNTRKIVERVEAGFQEIVDKILIRIEDEGQRSNQSI